MSESKKIETFLDFFYLIDNSLSPKEREVYSTRLSGNFSHLKNEFGLLDQKVPIVPRAVVSPFLVKEMRQNQKRIQKQLLDELTFVIERFENLSQNRFGGQEDPLLITL